MKLQHKKNNSYNNNNTWHTTAAAASARGPKWRCYCCCCPKVQCSSLATFRLPTHTHTYKRTHSQSENSRQSRSHEWRRVVSTAAHCTHKSHAPICLCMSLWVPLCVCTVYWVNAYVISFAWNFIGSSKISPIAGGERLHQYLIHKDKQQHEMHKINTTTTVPAAASVVKGICVYRCACVC